MAKGAKREAPVPVRLPPALQEEARGLAATKGLTLSGWIRGLIEAECHWHRERPPGDPNPPTAADIEQLKQTLREDAERRGAVLTERSVRTCSRHRKLETAPGPMCDSRCQAEWNR